MTDLDVCLVLHPYTARKDIGAGHDRYAYELLSRLSTFGAKVTTFDSGHLKTIPQALKAEATAILKLKRRTHRVFHATATANAMAPITANKHPLVTTIHDVLWFFVKAKYDSGLKYFLKANAIKRAAYKSDAIIVPFESTREFLTSELGVSNSKIRLVRYGVDHEQFFPLGNGEELPRPSFFPRNRRVILFVGAVNFGKGVDTLIRCFPQVAAANPDVDLVIGSGGWDTPLVRKIWKECPAKDRIHFTGFIPEELLRSAYIHADVTCFPSRYGFGLATLESMACGTPTVSGRTLDAPEFVGDAGLMTDPESEEELSTALNAILQDSSLAKSLKEKGLAKASQYRWEATAKETTSVYREFL